MQLEVNKVLSNEVPEHQDVTITAFIYPTDIVKMEQALFNKDYTEVLFPWGETMIVNEEIFKFKQRVGAFNKQKEEDERNEERNRDLGI